MCVCAFCVSVAVAAMLLSPLYLRFFVVVIVWAVSLCSALGDRAHPTDSRTLRVGQWRRLRAAHAFLFSKHWKAFVVLNPTCEM